MNPMSVYATNSFVEPRLNLTKYPDTVIKNQQNVKKESQNIRRHRFVSLINPVQDENCHPLVSIPLFQNSEA